jgi:hypothetical protein
MTQKQNFTRRQFLKAVAAGRASCALGVLAGNHIPKTWDLQLSSHQLKVLYFSK